LTPPGRFPWGIAGSHGVFYRLRTTQQQVELAIEVGLRFWRELSPESEPPREELRPCLSARHRQAEVHRGRCSSPGFYGRCQIRFDDETWCVS